MKNEMPLITQEWLDARVREEVGGCLVWTGYSQRGDPKANVGGKPRNVRQLVWKMHTGSDPRKGLFVRCTCTTPDCVAFEHLERKPDTFRNKGRKQTLQARAAVAAGLRARSKIAAEIEAIRNNPTTQQEEAARVGISQTMVSHIRLGKNWRPLVSPFAGLGAR